MGMLVVLAVCVVTTAGGEARMWRSRRGKTIEAEFVKKEGSAVYLKTGDGRSLKIYLSALSKEDRNFVLGAGGAESAPETEPGVPQPLPADFPWPVGKIAGPVAVEEGKAEDGEKWSYYLYLPKGLSLHRKWPVMFVMSPGGGEKSRTLTRYVRGAEWNDWILAMSVQSRNGFKESDKAVSAMVEDVRKRLPVDEDRMYATGFSGGSRMAFWLGEQEGTPLAGILACGAGGSRADLPPETVVYGICGSNCFNRWDMACTHRELKNKHNRLEFFVGKHAWAGQDMIRDGITYLNLVTLEDTRRTDKAAAVERSAMCAKVLKEIEAEIHDKPTHAYEWALFLSEYKAVPEARRGAATHLAMLKKEPVVSRYVSARADVQAFVKRHFATDVMDYVNNNGTKAAADDAEKYAKQHKETALKTLFEHMGQASAKP